MNKAIKELQKYKNILLNEAAIGGYISDTKNIDEAIAELKATQARLDNLRDYCNSAYVSYPDGYKFALGYIQARKDILTKLEQGSKEQ